MTSKLVRASDQVQIWSATYDSEPKSMLAFQRELSTTIAQQIRLRLSPERLDALARRQAHNPEAYDAYLQGRYYWNLFTPGRRRAKRSRRHQRATQTLIRTTRWHGRDWQMPLHQARSMRMLRRERCGRRRDGRRSRRLLPSRSWQRHRPRWDLRSSGWTGTGARAEASYRKAIAII